jgi:hypothetical protein
MSHMPLPVLSLTRALVPAQQTLVTPLPLLTKNALLTAVRLKNVLRPLSKPALLPAVALRHAPPCKPLSKPALPEAVALRNAPPLLPLLPAKALLARLQIGPLPTRLLPMLLLLRPVRLPAKLAKALASAMPNVMPLASRPWTLLLPLPKRPLLMPLPLPLPRKLLQTRLPQLPKPLLVRAPALVPSPTLRLKPPWTHFKMLAPEAQVLQLVPLHTNNALQMAVRLKNALLLLTKLALLLAVPLSNVPPCETPSKPALPKAVPRSSARPPLQAA